MFGFVESQLTSTICSKILGVFMFSLVTKGSRGPGRGEGRGVRGRGMKKRGLERGEERGRGREDRKGGGREGGRDLRRGWNLPLSGVGVRQGEQLALTFPNEN